MYDGKAYSAAQLPSGRPSRRRSSGVAQPSRTNDTDAHGLCGPLLHRLVADLRRRLRGRCAGGGLCVPLLRRGSLRVPALPHPEVPWKPPSQARAASRVSKSLKKSPRRSSATISPNRLLHGGSPARHTTASLIP